MPYNFYETTIYGRPYLYPTQEPISPSFNQNLYAAAKYMHACMCT